jgi:regulator of sigma E protease
MTYMQIFAMVSQFILGLSFIVGIHELGHLLFAKIFGMQVDSYTIGFPPKIFKFKWGETEYGLGVIPLGGSVKIAGMVDESLDTGHIGEPPQAWEFRAKPAWQRLVVILGGIICNIISGILIYVSLAFWVGESYLPKDEVNRYGIVPNALGISLGFQEGDKVLDINGKEFSRFADILEPRTLLQADAYYTIERDGQVMRIHVPADFVERLAEDQHQREFISPRLPFVVSEVQKGSGAQVAGLQPGDQIIEVAGQEILYFHQLQAILLRHVGEQVEVKYLRKGSLQSALAQLDQHGKLGFSPQILLHYKKQTYNLNQALAIGPQRAFEVIKVNVLGLMKIITGKISASKSLSGPIGIAQIFGRYFDWVHFWSVTGLLSMVLAFTNLLPIPALDGGHAVLIICEIIIGRPLSDRILERVQKVGLAILMLLIGYAIFNDLYKLL